MSIRIIVELHVKQQHRPKIQALFCDLLQQTRARSGNEGVKVLTGLDADTEVMLIEQWASLDDYQEYNLWRAERGDLAMLGSMLNKPPVRRYFQFMPV